MSDASLHLMMGKAFLRYGVSVWLEGLRDWCDRWIIELRKPVEEKP